MFDPVVLTEIGLPTGQMYRFTYNVYGEIDKVYHPAGGYERFGYAQFPGLSYVDPPYGQANRGVRHRWVSPSGGGGDEAHWEYGVTTGTYFGPPYTAFTISQHTNFPASAAINGDRKGAGWGTPSGGWNDATANAYPDWLEVSFSGAKSIDEVSVFTLQDNYASPSEPTEGMTFTLYGVTSFEVQYWTGSGGSVSANNKVWRKVTFPAVTTTKIRVLVTNALDGHSRVTEVEAWGPTGAGGGGASVNWLVSDHLGTPRMVVDQTGSLAGITRHDYLPFGEELGAGVGGRAPAQGYSQSDGVRQRFTGYERDGETGLDYARARYYANLPGRFISPDVWGGSVFNPQTLNRYTYVMNNPLKYIDPTGRIAQDSRKPLPDPQPEDPNCGCHPYDEDNVVRVVSNVERNTSDPPSDQRYVYTNVSGSFLGPTFWGGVGGIKYEHKTRKPYLYLGPAAGGPRGASGSVTWSRDTITTGIPELGIAGGIPFKGDFGPVGSISVAPTTDYAGIINSDHLSQALSRSFSLSQEEGFGNKGVQVSLTFTFDLTTGPLPDNPTWVATDMALKQGQAKVSAHVATSSTRPAGPR